MRFRSQEGLGTYRSAPRAPATPAAPGAGVDGPLLGFRGRTGRMYTFRRVRPFDGPAGSLRVAVIDAAGTPTAGAGLDFRAPDGLVSSGGTTEGAPFATQGPPGEWTITITPPPGYALGPGQPNPVRVTVVARQRVEVRIVLGRIAPG